jgi:hypothetical protein
MTAAQESPTQHSSSATRGEGPQSYYGRPILKEPVWTWEIPVYFFFGGLAGAASVLSLVARAGGNERLARTTTYIAAAGDAVSPILLISDLGRPERFANMFRVFKVTSPMSVGSWVLGLSGTANGFAAFCELLDILPRLKVAADTVSALLGPLLSTYTATLVADTAIPVWHEGRRRGQARASVRLRGQLGSHRRCDDSPVRACGRRGARPPTPRPRHGDRRNGDATHGAPARLRRRAVQDRDRR